MKKLPVAYFIFSLFLVSCADSPEQQARQSGKEIFFAEEMHDYGEIKENSDGTYKFIFKNISDTPLVINRVRSTCGCTVPSWPGEPIEPGNQGEIVVRYNTEIKGTFQKSIYVYSTAANSPVKLLIKGKVIPEKTIPDAENIP